jgi:methyl-accepting chemotaxis protein
MAIAALALFISSHVSVMRSIERGMETTLTRLNENDAKLVERQIKALGEDVGSYLTNMENEIDRRMLNAAIALQITVTSGGVSDRELELLAQKTGMDDLYITDIDGVFIQSTEKAAIGLSLFGIWDGYRMLVDDRAKELPSPIKIKEETGEIFKFTAIPRLDARGKVTGVLEAALEASSSIGRMLQDQIRDNPQLKFINIIEPKGLVLTANAAPGALPVAPFKAGETIRDREILGVAASNAPFFKWAADKKTITYCKPIERFGGMAYILCLNVDPASYLENTVFVNASFAEFEKSYSKGMMAVACVSGGLIALTILLYTSFIRFGMLRPLKELSDVMENISDGSGDLTRRLTVRGDDEIGRLAKRFNAFAAEIMKTVFEAKSAADVVTHGSSQVMLNVDASYSGVKSVSERVKSLSENIASQARGVDGCEEISDQLLMDCEYLSAQISEAIQAIERIMGNKENGERKISDLAEKNRAGIEKNRKTANDIRELNTQIADITSIIDEIKTVAKQTQLLSLNASIEAASAGEHGKGFAVVAAAVKGLAEQSANSAFKIQRIIASIGQSSAESVQAVTEVLRIAEEQNTSAEAMRETFVGIASEIEAINGVFGNVNDSLNMVSSVSGKMRDGIRDIRAIGLENKQSVESVGESMASQVDAIENIKSLSDKTASTIEELKETLDRFNVEKQ